MTAPTHVRVRAALIRLAATGLVAILSAMSSTAVPEGGGRVVSLKNGRLEKMDAPNWVALSKGSVVNHGDRLRTDGKTVAIVNLPGKGNFVIGPNTDIRLGAGGKKFDTLMSKGSVWINADELPKGAVMTLKTPQATTGVRGTKFSVLADDNGGAICTCEGVVDVIFGDTDVVPSQGKHFVEIGADGSHPSAAQSDIHLLRRKKKDRYQWCFTCHEVGKRGALIADWDRL